MASLKVSAYQDAWNLAIVAPSADVAPEVCNALLLTGKPFGCLMSSDLVSWVPFVGGIRDAKIEASLASTLKVSFLDSGLTWVVGGTRLSAGHKVFSGDKAVVDDTAGLRAFSPAAQRQRLENGSRVSTGAAHEAKSVFITNAESDEKAISAKSYAKEPGQPDEIKAAPADPASSVGIAAEVGDVQKEWSQEQEEELDDLVPRGGEMVKLESGLRVVLRDGDTAKILVPSRRREALIARAHASMHHASWKKVLAALRVQYEWRGMTAAVRKVVQLCSSCALVKARRNLMHGQFASLSFDGPRVAYAMDFYEVAESSAGYNWILTVIDMFSTCCLSQ